MPEQRIDCEVLIDDDMKVGTFANAFRLLHDHNQEWFLDFVVLSPSQNTGKVVARVRVHESFLTNIRDRLGASITEITTARQSQKETSLAKGLSVVPNGVGNLPSGGAPPDKGDLN